MVLNRHSFYGALGVCVKTLSNAMPLESKIYVVPTRDKNFLSPLSQN